MSVIGEKYSVELLRKKSHGADWTVLKLIDNDGTELGCRWHIDAAPREIAVALHALADQLDPDPTNIYPRCAVILRFITNLFKELLKCSLNFGKIFCFL